MRANIYAAPSSTRTTAPHATAVGVSGAYVQLQTTATSVTETPTASPPDHQRCPSQREQVALRQTATKPSHLAKHSMAPGYNTNKAMIRDHLTRQTDATTGRSHRRDIGSLVAPPGRRARTLECDVLLRRLGTRFCGR